MTEVVCCFALLWFVLTIPAPKLNHNFEQIELDHGDQIDAGQAVEEEQKECSDEVNLDWCCF